MSAVVVADGKKVRTGDRVCFIRFDNLHWEGTVHSIEETTTTKKVDGKVAETKKEQAIVIVFDDGERHSFCERLFYRIHSGSVQIAVANGKKVGEGDFVWIWRCQPNCPTLVRKQVVNLDPHRGLIQLAYEDNPGWARKEPPQSCYVTKEEARAAHPDKTRLLENAMMRMGRLLGREAA